MLPMDGVAQKRYGPHPKLGKTGNPCNSGNREIFQKNREAIEHERAITERD